MQTNVARNRCLIREWKKGIGYLEANTGLRGSTFAKVCPDFANSVVEDLEFLGS